MTEVGILAAFAAGVLALLSPCSALLLPSFFAYAFVSRGTLLLRTLAFYGGLLITLVPLGTGAGFASALFYGHRQMLVDLAGWTIIVLGVLMLTGRAFAFPFADRLQAWAARRGGAGSGWVSVVVLGAVYGLAGFCSGPVLGAILTMAATSDSPVAGGALLAVYAAGMAAPLFVLAALWDRFDLGHRGWLRGRTVRLGPVNVHTTSLISGTLFIAIGALFLRFDGTAGITGFLGLGDTTDLELAAQDWIEQATATIPAWAPPAVIALLAATAALWSLRRERQGDPGQPGSGQSSPNGSGHAETEANQRSPRRTAKS